MEILLLIGFCWLCAVLYQPDESKKEAKKKRSKKRSGYKPHTPTYAEWWEWEKNK